MTLTLVTPRRPRYQSFTLEEDAELRRLAAEGLTAREIAVALGTGRDRNTVTGRARLLGVTLARAAVGRKPEGEPDAALRCVRCGILYTTTGAEATEDGRCVWCAAGV